MSDDMKEIAKLKFDTRQAMEDLNIIEKKMQEISKTINISFSQNQGINTLEKNLKKVSGYTTEFGNKMKYTLSGKVDFSKMINVKSVEESLKKVKQISERQAQSLTTTIMKTETRITGVRKEQAERRSTIEKNSLAKQLIEEQRHIDRMKEKEQDLTNFLAKEQARRETAQFKTNLREEAKQKSIWDKFKSTATGVAIGSLVSTGLYELKQTASEVITEMTDVEYKMIEIDRVLNDSSINIDNYRDKLIQLAYDYGNSFDNVSDVTLRLAKAGFDANESLALTEKTLLALNTADLDATQATEDMVAVMSQWNLTTGNATKEAEDYAKIIDEINIIADNFPITSEDLMEALKKTSSAFNIAGASIEETIATIVAAEKASQRGGKAIGTAMNNIVQQLRDTKKIATMEALGLDIYTDSTKNEFKSVMDILQELSDKMQQLKDEGKENTKEMRDLLSVFTLFRRNVGTALLGEMGEGGTYDEVLKLLGENGEGALGYSLQENEKHMKTAKAAMEQFNAELLKLKTAIWDNGAEDVFKGLLVLGGKLVGVITDLVEAFGRMRTTFSIIVDLFNVFSENLTEIKEGFEQIKEATNFIQEINEKIEETGIIGEGINVYIDTLKESLLEINPAMKPILELLDELGESSETSGQLVDEWADKIKENIEKVSDQSQIETTIETTDEVFSSINSNLNTSLEQLDKYAEKYQILDSAVSEFNTTGQMTSETLQSLVSNDLLQYLDLTAEKASINTNELLNLGEAQKIQAIEALQSAASLDIEKLAMGDVQSISPIAKAAIAQFGDEAVATGNKAASSVGAIESMAKALQDAHDAALGKLGKGVSATNFEKQSKAVIKSYTKYAEQISKLDISSPLYKGKSGGGTSSRGSGGGGSAKQATKTFEEQSQERIKIFKEEINKLTSLEEDWVNKYKKLNLLSTSDLMFIQHQRINKYGDILNQINNLTGISEKDRTELIQEYSKKRQEAELEYFDLLKDKLDEQIKKLKEANEERIKGIKEAAEAQINALKKVDNENDRIKQKQEYERKRQELIYGNQGIEYWKQRTGREAQLALQDAEEKLRDLDEDWEEKKKDWTLNDQIEQIEKARDAQIKAIEDAQERQIEGWQKAYEEQVRLYAETGQIIYDNSVINAGYLYNAYMDNFVNPLQSQLQNVINSLNTASATASEVASKVGSAGGGGGSGGSKILEGPLVVPAKAQAVQTLKTTINNISPITNAAKNVANDIASIASNATHAFKKLIGKAHGGGEIRSNTEGLVLLRPQEVVLTPEWAAGMDKLVKQINQGNIIGGGNNTNIDVQGNLINMDGVKINDRKDADYLTEKIEKVFRDKFNVRK